MDERDYKGYRDDQSANYILPRMRVKDKHVKPVSLENQRLAVIGKFCFLIKYVCLGDRKPTESSWHGTTNTLQSYNHS